MKTRKVIAIFGKTGAGKSTLAKKIIKEYNRVIIIDVFHEYSSGVIFYSLESFFKYLKKNGVKQEFSFIFRLSNDAEIDNLFLFVREIENFLLVVEESEIYISPFAKKNNFLWLVRYGRHKEISILAIARRAVEFSHDFRAQLNTLYTFKHTNFRDVELMKKMGVIDVDKLNSEKYEFKKVDF